MSEIQIKGFQKPEWDKFSGVNGAYVALSEDSKMEAIAEPVDGGYLCFFVNMDNGETLKSEFISA